ncbi:hypothetical protein EZJ43_11580 [Pedobacter changchengzhani]|uniref:YceK/YidQ family lipoprotein n=1 Tax=Pedobacter changchengzhani TaxID=2529274 RepID=A0A4R5MJT2_9SPHI|nr:hypothetical protein [Pedobacter changchengzhani]TDG35656.1 hypothetical protein EZJ43_11580 [Pedobacter changchengzhani]
MKKILLTLTVSTLLLSSCGTLFNGGKPTAHQQTKPTPPAKRQLKAGAFIADILIFPPALILDFVNGTIYQKQAN